ncbi:SSI family serine proteinase inhibitor [Streptosporangium roseum]|uniref:SSI family serine proteinase inhibitor n=1 Tax=Streptosporangium roseum TaxID=2001 RepID=UPI00068C2318|nr:SSI family serine proteinase inhibitor [Streptosporangium roseum]
MRTVKIVSAAAAFALATALPPAASPASDRSPVPGGGSALTLTLSVADGTNSGVSLTCDREGGSHPDPFTACGLIRRVGGDLSKLAYDIDMICPEEYLPHTVRALGTWEGRPVWFGRTYDNRCEMTALTGPLFHI